MSRSVPNDDELLVLLAIAPSTASKYPDTQSRITAIICISKYKNIEVILVDDGSPDKCGEIDDIYEVKDTRVKSVHKENGGLSDARNYGMKYVAGEYVVFVDSDDWIKEEMIETLVE